MKTAAFIIAGIVVVVYLIFIWRNYQSTELRRSKRRLKLSERYSSQLDSKTEGGSRDKPKIDLHKGRRLSRRKKRF